MKKLIVLFLLSFALHGIKANTCLNATNLTIKDSLVPDTFLFSGTEYWFTFTGNIETTFYLTNYISETFTGINQIDLFTGTCSGRLVNLFSTTNIDTLTMFKYTLELGTTYFIKLTRPSGLSNNYFSFLASTYMPINQCVYDPCQYIKNGSFNLSPNVNYTNFWTQTPPNQFHDYFICGWKDAWGTPNLQNPSNLNAFMWSVNNAQGEAIVQDISNRQLIPGHSYTLSYKYNATGTNGGNLSFVLSTFNIGSFPLNNGSTSLYVSGTFNIPISTTLNTSGQWITYNSTFIAPSFPSSGLPYLTLVIVPHSFGSSPLYVKIDDISIVDNTLISGTLSGTNATCKGCDGLINLSVSNGVSPFTYNWIGPDNYSASSQNISMLCPGIYNVTITDAIGCTWSGSYTIEKDIFELASWPQLTISTGNEGISDMTTDIYGNVYAIGWFSNQLTLGNNTFNAQTGYNGIFIVKYDVCGNVLNCKYYGGVGGDNADLHIEFFNSRLIVAGNFNFIDFTGGGNTMNSLGSTDVFLATLDPSTLLCSASQQVQIGSTSGDKVKGLSIKGNAVYIAGVFSGPTLTFSNSTTTLTQSGGGDLFVCRFLYTLSSLYFAKNYPNIYYDEGFNLQSINTNYTPFFTYMQTDANGFKHSYIAKLNSITGDIVTSTQIGTGNEYFEIYDMNTYSTSNNLYLCGYYKATSQSTERLAAIIYYPTPNTNLAWTSATCLKSYANTGSSCEATKIAVNANGVFISGTYNFSGFKIGVAPSNWSPSISVYGTTNHFVFKTNASLDPTSGWMSGVASSTIGTSRGNTLINDAAHSVYYLGGAFNGYTVLTGTTGQTMTPYSDGGYDGFIARFDDNSGANFRLLPFENDSLSIISNNKILIYPNPSNGKIKITSLKNSEIQGIAITDITGRVVYKKNYETELSEREVDLSFLIEGSYFANILTNDENKNVIKLVIIK